MKTSDYITLVLTHKCTRNCYFCIDKYRNKLENEMSLETVENAIKYAQSNKIKTIALLGGEPTLHPDIKVIVKMIKDAGFKVLITSNFDKLDIIQDLSDEVDYFNFSIYNDAVFNEDFNILKNFKAGVTLSKLLHNVDKESMDKLIARGNELNCSVKFSSTVGVDTNLNWLDKIVEDEFILFDEIIGQSYKGAIIKRYDKQIVNKNAEQSMKFLVSGKMSTSWEL